jgi:DNA-binding response OmpR family regulator
MNEKILVIDDEPLILTTIERALTKKGYQVIITSDADSFFEALDTSKADLLIMDLHLGGGLTADAMMEEIRYISPESKVLIISGGVPEYETGHFLEKPFKIDELRQKVREILDLNEP